jgi:hypothetical protein
MDAENVQDAKIVRVASERLSSEAAHGVCRSVDLVSAAPRELSSDWNVKSVTRYIVKSGAGAASPPTEFFTTQHQTKIARSKNFFLLKKSILLHMYRKRLMMCSKIRRLLHNSFMSIKSTR